MSRDITTDFKNAITAGSVKPLILVEAFFDSDTLRFWNGIGELTYNSNTYIGSGNLLSISEITETQNVEARGLEFELSGIPSSLLSVALSEEYQDRNISVHFAPLDATDTVISDPFTFFSGKTDVMEIEEGRETSVIKLSAESDIVVLKRANERRRTPEDQKLTYSNDTFFDQVASLQSLEINWGKGQ